MRVGRVSGVRSAQCPHTDMREEEQGEGVFKARGNFALESKEKWLTFILYFAGGRRVVPLRGGRVPPVRGGGGGAALC